MAKQKILLDTDIGQDMDDACSIAYLCAHPDSDLIGITTVSGEAVSRAKLASAVCTSMGRPDIPIYPGLETCILKEQHQSFCPQTHLLDTWDHKKEFPKNEAIHFLQQTIRDNPGEIILATIGPLSNIAILFQMDPELPSLLKGMYMMGGKYQQYELRTWRKKDNDNTFSIATNGRNMEWNACIDPYATAMVVGHKLPLFRAVGEDITHQVYLTPEQFKDTLGKKLPAILVEMSKAWIDYDPLEAKKLCYHDPVCIATIFNDAICKFQQGNISVEKSSKELLGYTFFEEDENGMHEIAFEVNPDAFFEEFSSVF